MNRFSALLTAALFLAIAARAQAPPATVRVEVVSNSKPVPDAAVTIGDATLKTDSAGIAISPVQPGLVRIAASKEGYFPAQTSVTAVSGELSVTIELEEQEEEKESITVSATRTGVRVQDSPTHVEVLDREEIEEKMLMTPGDIVMLLNEMGGMRVQTTSPSLGAAGVRVQGMLGRYTAFLSDGLPLFGQQGAGLGLLQIPPVDLGAVEVIKGNASALYGGSAMAGVVDLISRRPTEQPIREFLFNRTSLGGTDAAAFLAGSLTARWSASLLTSVNGQTRRDVSRDGWADLAGYARAVLRPRVYWDNQQGSSALFTGGWTYENRNGGTMNGSVLPITGQPYAESLRTRRSDVGVNAQWLLPSGRVAALRISHSAQLHRHGFGEISERDRHDLTFAELSLRGSAGRHLWIAGAAVQRDAYIPRDAPRFAYTYVVPGIFLQDDINLASWFSLSASLRADVHNRYGAFASPRIAALVRRGKWTGRFSTGLGFFAPTPLTEETEAAGLARLASVPALSAERGRSVTADLTRTYGPLTVTGTFFASNIAHPVYVDRDSTYRIVNLAEPRKNRGAELLATWRKAPFAATFSYSYVRASEVDPRGRRADVPLTPRQSFGIVAMWEKEDAARFGIECYYTGAQQLENNPYRGRSRPYLILGAMAERRVNRFTKLFLNLENLANVRQTRWDPILLPQRSPDGRWTVDAWAPLDGRVINGGARFNF